MLGVIAAAILWGCAYVLTKVVLVGASPLFVAFGRVALGSLVLLPTLRWTRQRLPDRGQWGHLAVLALTLGIAPFALTAWAQQHVNSSVASVLMAAVPLFTAPFAAVLLRERLRRSQFIGLGVGLVGVAVLAGLGSSSLMGTSMAGIAALLGAAACYGFGYTYIKRYLAALSPLQVAAGSQLIAAIGLAPLAVGDAAHHGVSFTPLAALCMVLLGVLSTGAAQLINYRNIARVGPTLASLAMYLIPLVGVLAGLLAFHEPVTARIPLGAVIILVSLAVTQYRPCAAGRHRLGDARPPDTAPATDPPAVQSLATHAPVQVTEVAVACVYPVLFDLGHGADRRIGPNAARPVRAAGTADVATGKAGVMVGASPR